MPCAPKSCRVFSAHAMRAEILPSFCLRMPCAPKSCRVFSAHVMRAEFLPGFVRACHARRILAGFCLRMSCAPKSCWVLLCACRASRNLGAFRFKKNFGGRNLPGFASKRILATKRRRGAPAKFTWYPAKLPCPGWGLGRRPLAPQQFNNSTNKHLNTPAPPPVQTAGRLIPVILR